MLVGKGGTPRIKICGLTRVEDVAVACAEGAAYIGVILAGGPRVLTVDAAARVLGPSRPHIQRVAVFGAQSDEAILAAADGLDLDVVQLHGDPSVEQLRRLRERTHRILWPVVRVAGAALPDDTTALAQVAGVVVLDAKTTGQLGGTGVRLDWQGLRDSVRALRLAVPDVCVVLAGGLRSENVREAVALLQPDIVDVSSGVESAPGVKDAQAIQQFVSAVLTAQGNGYDSCSPSECPD